VYALKLYLEEGYGPWGPCKGALNFVKEAAAANSEELTRAKHALKLATRKAKREWADDIITSGNV
jgi:hypothetical protein